MPEYLQPGVYVEEISRGPRPIEGVPTGTAAMLGAAERGSTRPQFISSLAEYSRHFGAELNADSFLAAAVQGFFENGGRQVVVCRVAGRDASTAALEIAGLRINARGPGAWAHRLWLKLGPGSAQDAHGTPTVFRLRIALFAPGVAPFDCFETPDPARMPQLIEDHDNFSLPPGSAPLPDNSLLVELAHIAGAAPQAPVQFSGGLTGGADGAALQAADFAPALVLLESEPYRDVALVYSPGADLATRRALISHCEANRFRFAVLDADRMSILTTLEPRDDNPDSAFAACYWPWLLVASTGNSKTRDVPPGGHVLGLYARTDGERGVHKAPANETLRGVVGLAQDLNARQQDALQELRINAIRKFAGRGIRVWGARTLSSDPQWKYVNMRRFLLYLERSIQAGIEWAVFEPNDAKLWARVKDSVSQFLLAHWRSGALLGDRAEKAFYVRCDQSTMTQADVVAGRLICEVGVAAVRPAEFVVIRITQQTLE